MNSLLEARSAELQSYGLELTPKSILAMQTERLRQKIWGISATLLPFEDDAVTPHWSDFRNHVSRTEQAELTVAVNMDTGFRHLLDESTAVRVLNETRDVTVPKANLDGGKFVAGAFVGDRPGAKFDLDAYARQIDHIQKRNGVPVIFQSHGLTGPGDIVERYRQLSAKCGRFIAFELGTMFAPFGKIYDLETYKGLMEIQNCIGAKHSSLDRGLELQRLAMRDAFNPQFRVFTGNDLAIDMTRYGSDYLLGLSTFAPNKFAQRDRAWENGDVVGFDAINDPLQDLGNLAFRNPVPAYRHSAAQFLRHVTDSISTDVTHHQSPMRPRSDIPLLRRIGEKLGVA